MSELSAMNEEHGRSGDDDNTSPDLEIKDWEWRRKIRSNPHSHGIYRIVVGVVGLVILIGGLIMVPFPGPGWLVVFLGLAIWASEFEWAKRLLQRARNLVSIWTEWLKSQPLWMKGLMLLISIAAVAAILWLVLLISDISSFLPEWVVDLVVKLPGL